MNGEEALKWLTDLRSSLAVPCGSALSEERKSFCEAVDVALSALSRDSTYRRALYLLDATYRLLEKQVESRCVLNILATTVDYDDADCDGNCLMEDIKDLFFEAEYHPEPPKEET